MDTNHGRTADIIAFSSLDRTILVRVETKRTKRSERKTCWMIIVEDPSLLALNESLKPRPCWERIFDEFKHVSDMDLVSGLTCLSDFASSLFQISNMFVIVMEEELYQAVLYRLEGDRLMQMSLQMSMPNMHIQDKDIENNVTIENNEAIRTMKPSQTMKQSRTMKSCFD
ncbi:hypothetical protein EDC96DRAFT_545545 [Choanephora cucurbitarum]|nr:hypothetical protein EDC96DRAFT_545545 [Choanephora cucurbitarum]